MHRQMAENIIISSEEKEAVDWFTVRSAIEFMDVETGTPIEKIQMAIALGYALGALDSSFEHGADLSNTAIGEKDTYSLVDMAQNKLRKLVREDPLILHEEDRVVD